MYTPDIEGVAKRVLDSVGQHFVASLVEKKETVLAKKYLLGEIDRRFMRGEITFEDAAEAYHLLMVRQWRTRRFPQKHLFIESD
ncbi:MAG: hypothetical protein PHD04_02755 [Candidatus Pacebacteria bacterium]|nr:hypothetical protein [Candidatus Paceibacterota bacterium]